MRHHAWRCVLFMILIAPRTAAAAEPWSSTPPRGEAVNAAASDPDGDVPYAAGNGGRSLTALGELPQLLFDLTGSTDASIVDPATCAYGAHALTRGVFDSSGREAAGCAVGAGDNRDAWPLAPVFVLALLVLVHRLRSPD